MQLHGAPVQCATSPERHLWWECPDTDMDEMELRAAKIVADMLAAYAVIFALRPWLCELVMNRAAYRITGGKEELLDTLLALLDPVEIDIVVLRSVADLMEAVHEQQQLDSSRRTILLSDDHDPPWYSPKATPAPPRQPKPRTHLWTVETHRHT
jgi:hypothetical protein